MIDKLSNKDYRLKFPRLKEYAEKCFLLQHGLTREEYIRYLTDKNYAKTDEEREKIKEKNYALIVKNREENKINAKEIPFIRN